MIKPFGNQILVEPTKADRVIGEERSLCQYGKVIEIGSEVKHIKKGDTIGFTTWGVNDLEIEEIKYYFVMEDSRFILGTIHD